MNRYGKKPKRKAFTLIELLVAFAILVGLTAGIYQVFSSVNREASLAAWTSSSQKQLKLGLKRIGEELSKASYYRSIEAAKVSYLDLDEGEHPNQEAVEELYAVEVDDVTYSGDGARKRVLFWLQAEPKQEGDPDSGYLAACEVFLEDNTLYFQRDHAQGNTALVQEGLFKLIDNVEEVSTSVRSKEDTSEIIHGSMVDLEVKTYHPNKGMFKNSRLSQQFTARVPVTFKAVE